MEDLDGLLSKASREAKLVPQPTDLDRFAGFVAAGAIITSVTPSTVTAERAGLTEVLEVEGGLAEDHYRRLNWAYAERLLDLLETGEHEYLKGLIDRLHEAWSVQRDRNVKPGERTLDRYHESGQQTPGRSSEFTVPITEPPVALPHPDPGVPPLARRTRSRSKTT